MSMPTDTRLKGAAKKRGRTMTKDDDTGDCQTNPDTNIVSRALEKDINITPPSSTKERCPQGSHEELFEAQG
jgi:hypothetical protein